MFNTVVNVQALSQPIYARESSRENLRVVWFNDIIRGLNQGWIANGWLFVSEQFSQKLAKNNRNI